MHRVSTGRTGRVIYSKRPKSAFSHLPLPIAGLSCGHQSFADTAPIRPSVFHSTLNQSSRFLTNSSLSFLLTSTGSRDSLCIISFIYFYYHQALSHTRVAGCNSRSIQPGFPSRQEASKLRPANRHIDLPLRSNNCRVSLGAIFI